MNVLDLVGRESQRLRRRAAVASTLLPLVTLVGLLTSAATWLSDGGWLTLPRALPVLSWALALGAAGTLGLFVRRRLTARSAPMAVAAAIEREQDLRRGSLTGLLEVADAGIFAEHAAEALGGKLRLAHERPAPRLRRRLQRAALLSALAAIQIAALASTSWARRADGWRALLNPVDAWRGALVEPLAIAEVPSRVMRGADVPLRIAAPGRTQVSLRWRATGGAWQESVLPVDSSGASEASIPSVTADLFVLVSDGRAGRDSAQVQVVDRPFVGDVRVMARYPAYLGRSDERLPADATLRIPMGTRLAITGTASEPLASVTLRAEAQTQALRTEGARFEGAFMPSRSATWSWEVQGAAQAIADVPPALDIEVVVDSVPHAEILLPTGEQFVTSQGSVALELLAQDDYALQRVALRVRRLGSTAPARETVVSDRREALWSGATIFELAPYALSPGEALEVTLVARDAAPGEREGVSAPLVLRVPTAEEAREAARESADAAVSAADAAARELAAMAERTANEARARSDRAGGESRTGTQPQDAQPQSAAAAQPQPGGAPREQLGFDGAERAREIAEEQRAMREQVSQLEDAARELEERLQRAGALDTALARQLQDAQRLLREAITPEMSAALERLEDATQQLDAPRTRQSLAELAAQQQELRKTLERSAEMLRRAAMEGQMQTVADRAQELAEQQRALADSAQAGPEAQQRAQERAQQMQRQTEGLAQQAQQLAQRMEEANARQGAEGMREGAQQAQQAAEQLGQMAQDRGAGERAADAMERAAESLAGARQEQVGAWKAELTDALDRSVQEMVQLAREQDQLADQARQEQSPTALRPQQSALQQGVQAAQERLEEESRRTTLVSPRSQEMMERARQSSAQASREAAEGRRSGAEEAMRDAADALRQAAAQLTRDRERAGNAQSATGMPELLQQMQQLAQQQGGLNSQMQSLLSMMQRQAAAQGMDAATRDQARQLARAQREVARQLDEVSDADPTGRAQELAREARALAQALDQGAVDPATKTRQEQLLRRMLDAGRSLEQDQRDESQRREARAARAVGRHTPSGDPDTSPADRFRVPTWEELRGLSAEDRRLVIEYFRRLNAGERP